jgi:predicted DNA-binding transcriptional regulator AlpA
MLGGVAKSTLYYWQKRNAFPRGIHLGDKTVAWRRRAIRDWVAQRERQAA